MLNDMVVLYTTDPALFAGSVFLLGLIVGSFLNVVIYRLPVILEREWRSQAADVLSTSADPAAPASIEPFTLSTPRSACPNCKAPVTALQNIPVISWLVLRGRCADDSVCCGYGDCGPHDRAYHDGCEQARPHERQRDPVREQLVVDVDAGQGN